MKALVLEQAGPDPRLTVTDLPLPSVGDFDALVQVAACGFCHHDLLVMEGNPPPRRPNTPHPRPRGRRRRDRGWPPRHHRPSGRPRRLPPHRRLRTVPLVRPRPGAPLSGCASHRPQHEGRHGREDNGGRKQPGQNSRRNPLASSLPSRLPHRRCRQGRGKGPNSSLAKQSSSLAPAADWATHLVQLAKLKGARVLAITSDETKAPSLEALGTSDVIPTGELDFSEIVLALTEDRGVDVALDTVGSPLFSQTLRSIAPHRDGWSSWAKSTRAKV